MTKNAWRHAVRAARAKISAAERAERDAARAEAVADALAPALTAARRGQPAGSSGTFTVAAHVAVPPEPDTAALFARLTPLGVRWLLPVLTPVEATAAAADRGTAPANTTPEPESRRPPLDASPGSTPGAPPPNWAPWDGRADLVSGWRAIPQPSTAPLGAGGLAQADLILLPGLAGTPTGARLGRGAGWYDRALRHARPGVPRWLLLNAAEIVTNLPQDPWDVAVDALVTEAGFLPCRPLSETWNLSPTI